MGLPEVLFVFIGIMCVVLAVALTIAIFYFLTLQKALSRVAPENRLMEPAMVWLGLIPLFNIIWAFFIATRIPDSLRNEFAARRLPEEGDYGRSIGLTNAVLGVISVPLSVIANIAGNPAFADNRAAAAAPNPAMLAMSCINSVIGLVSLVLFIIFWVKIANFSSQLAQDSGRYYRDRDDYDDDYDDRGPRDSGPRDRGPPAPGPEGPSEGIRPDDRGQYR